MTKEEIKAAKIKAEQEISEKLIEIKRIYEQFKFYAQIDDPSGYLTLCIMDDVLSFNNSHLEMPEEAGIFVIRNILMMLKSDI